jgi:glycosyltransferase involved in cell wall biosynthesis
MATDRAAENIRPVVMLVSASLIYGGAESYCVKLARILIAEYRVVAVVCSAVLRDELRSVGVEVECLEHTLLFPLQRYVFSLRACRRMIRVHRPRIVHLNGQPESYLAVFLRFMGLRLLATRHAPFTDLYLRAGSRLPVVLKRWMTLFSLRMVHRIVCVSKLIQRQLHEVLPGHEIAFIPTWVTGDFLEACRRPLPSTPLRVLFVGRVARSKGIFEAIEAVRRCPLSHLMVVGEGDEMQAARESAKGLEVTFAGFQRDCKPMYRTADLLIFTSPEGFEGLPQVPLEAMATGLPCLASDISSIREIAGESRALAIYRQGDVGDLAEKLSQFAASKSMLVELGQAGRREIDSRFTESAVAGAYLEQFRLTLQSEDR